MNRKVQIALVLTLFCALCASNNAKAEFSPLGNEAGVINRQNQEQLKGFEIEKNYVETTDADIKKENEIKDKIEKKKDVVKGNLTYNPRFTLNKVEFEGNTVISDKALQKLAAQYIGK